MQFERHLMHIKVAIDVAFCFRRGAAFGLAGIIKGLGVSAINKYGTMDTLKKALDDQANADAREGALFAFEAMCEKLGRYAAYALPAALDKSLLHCKLSGLCHATV